MLSGDGEKKKAELGLERHARIFKQYNEKKTRDRKEEITRIMNG